MKRFLQASVLALVVLVTFSALPTVAATGPASADTPLVSETVRQLMQDRNYAEAVKAIDEAAQAEGAPRDYLAWLKGRALSLQEKHDQAVAVFEQLEKQFPQSPWARQARFGKAVALARKGDFRSAELIYRAEAEYLLSAERKQQIADIYLEFADLYFKPPKEEQKPDYQKAMEFYQKALEIGPMPQKRTEVELLVAQCQQNLGKLDQAVELYEKFIKNYPDSPLDIEARYRLGECRLGQGNLKEARRLWQDLLAKYPDSQSERIAEAAFKLSRTWKIPEPDDNEQLSLGTAALEAFIERFPTHKLASQAHLDVARSYIHRGRYEDAVASLNRFLADRRYEDRSEVPEARNLLGRSYQLQKKFPEALATWREYLAKHPAHKQWSSVQQEIVNTEYLMGLEKCQSKDYDAARKLWSEFLAKYPLDGRCAQILYQFGWMNHRQEKWEAAIEDWRRLVSKYPDTNEASTAQLMIAATLEQKLGKLEEALEQYRKITKGPAASQARQAVQRLTSKSLTLATGRVFRSDETPKLKLTLRNIESVTVRAYKVDLETYFRKMHLARGMEELDVALIDPDKTFEYKIPDYVKYQQLQRTVEVPLPGGARSGVMAVTVSSPTLEATTLVLQSDLDVIVKSSRDEVFVFAENMLTGKPWPGVRLLVSNGRQVFAEGTTGDDGVFQKACKELGDAGDVRAFAVAGTHVASNTVNLQGVEVARGLSDKGYIYTDRPAYRAGQLVHLRGCIRHAAGDAYTIQKDKKYTLDVFDSRNRLVRQEEVVLGPLGSFHTHFPLPPTSPQGEYRVLVHDEAKQSYQGSFQVHEYQLEPVHLTVDTPRKVYYRGEEIEGTIRAAFYYGAPLAGREIRYQLADDRLHTATTDEKGEVHFKLPTREFRETQVLPLVVILPERNLQGGANFFLAAQGFSIDVRSVRPVYMAGETFEVTVKASDAEGKPVGRKLTLKVLQQTTVQGQVGERLVQQHELETAKTDGAARQTLKLDRGGRYVLRAEGIDQFKNPITGQGIVQVSDDEDKVRLRILADKHTYKAGDTAEVQLHWREDPALALVTFQGARVLDHKLVRLQKGPNKLQIPMTARLAPNFELAVAVMTDPRPADEEKTAGAGDKPSDKDQQKAKDQDQPLRRFHAASSPFTVERDLRVTLSWKRKGEGGRGKAEGGDTPGHSESQSAIRPGEEIEVTLTTTDPQGKPAAAEVSLAMVEQSLLERFVWPVPAIHEFFRGEPRQPAVRTTSSITFDYRPATRPINPRLLAERERLEIAKEEEASRHPGPEAGSQPDFDSLVGLVTSPVQSDERELVEESADFELAAPEASGQRGSGRRETAKDKTRGGKPAGGAATDALARGDGTLEIQNRAALARRGAGTLVLRGAGGAATSAPAMQTQARHGGTTISEGKLALSNAGRVVAYGTFGFEKSSVFSGDLGLGENKDYLYFVPNVQNVRQLVDQDRRDVLVLNANGSVQSLNLAWREKWDSKQTEALAADLAKAGAVLLPGLAIHETGYWNPSIVTGEDGRATVTFAVPERSTAWTLLAKGITADTLAGEATSELVVKKDLFGELKLPLAFTDGDEAEVAVSVHNNAVDQGPIEVTLKTTIGGRSVEEKKTLDVKAKGIHELAFKTSLRRPEQIKDDRAVPAAGEVGVVFELTVAALQRRDVVRREIPLVPYGMPVFAAASGAASSDTTAWVEAPKDMPLSAPSLQVLIGPTVEQSLLDIVLAPAPWCQIESNRIASGLEIATSDLMASLGLQQLFGSSRDAGNPQAQALDSRIRSALALLLSAQNDDGGWSWTGRGGKSDRYPSARAVWAMSLARSAGYRVPDDSLQKAVGYLRSQVAATDNSDYESKAILLQGLAAAGQGDFALANRLHRDRPALSAAALVHLALALAEMDRKPMAVEVLGLLAQRNLDDPGSPRTAAQVSLPWSHSPAEVRALWALAVQKVSPESPKAKELVDWLLAHRTGHRWTPDKATGPAALALCGWFAKSRFEGEHYRLAVFVNDTQVKVLDIDGTAQTQAIDVPPTLLRKDKQRINFQITGRGRYTYQCILGGFVPADKLKSTTDQWRIRRIYEPAPLELDGREIPRGFGVLEGSYTTFRNPLTQLPVGRRGLVDLEIWRRDVLPNTPEERLEYLVITEPVPSGATVIEKSVQGGFERFEIAPGAITFYVGSRRSIGAIHYELHGYLPGTYRAGPTVIRNAYRPEQLVVSEPKPLTLLPPGTASSDQYRLTPQELYELGKRYFAKGDLKTAQGHLTELIEQWRPQTEVYKQAVQMLLDSHLELGPPNKVVRYFEIIKEKWPAEEIPFAKIVKVGKAYHEMGEYERSYLIFRATVEGSFVRESGVAGFLDSQGEFLRSVDVMGRLLREYPPEAYVGAASYSLAQRVYAKAPDAPNDPKLRQQKINRVDLVRRAWTMLEGFLSAYPDDPAADQAAFAGANALLELKSYDEAAAACTRYGQRYPQSDLLDSYWYMIGYCDFARGRHEAALEMCRKVAEAKRVDKKTGAEVESPNKWRAVYILGQVYHSLGKAVEAIREYRRVEDRFADAKEAIQYFVRKAIELPEVTTLKPGQAPELELKFRNIAACDVKVYRIDLMKFSLLRRNLGGITQINLAGIRPYHETTVSLGEGKDYRDRTHKLALPLKEEGAYLVVCRGDDLHASGLVLVTPLAVEVQEDAASGRVRTTVKDAAAGRYVNDVHVKVIGSRNDDFVSGSSDLRGVFVADGIKGTSTVIAQVEPSRYAFFRGQTNLGPEAPPVPAAAEARPAAEPAARTLDEQLLKGLQESNTLFQNQQVEQLKQMYQRDQKGVEAQKAF